MRHVTACEANQHFAKILSAVEQGEEVVISKRGRPVAVMSPHKTAMTAEGKAAIEHLRAVLNEPLITAEGFRTFSRDEMHERP